MPNWCSNSITITGNVETIKTLWEDATTGGDDKGLLNAIHPEPEDIGDEWYGWRVDNWGTKWEVSLEGLEFTDNGDGTASISGWFDSAWSPPIGAYERFTEQFDSCVLEASYFEPGCAFVGEFSSETGDACYEIDSEDFSNIPEHLMEDYCIEGWYETDEDEEEEMVIDDEA